MHHMVPDDMPYKWCTVFLKSPYSLSSKSGYPVHELASFDFEHVQGLHIIVIIAHSDARITRSDNFRVSDSSDN